MLETMEVLLNEELATVAYYYMHSVWKGILPSQCPLPGAAKGKFVVWGLPIDKDTCFNQKVTLSRCHPVLQRRDECNGIEQ
jgi:hypothetical protein